MKFERYSEYKDSGIGWLGDIPSDWEVKRLKNIALLKYSNVDKKSYDNQRDVLLCNYVNVYKNEFITNKINFMLATASKEEVKRFAIKKYDVLFTKDSESFDDNANPCLVNENINNLVCGYHLAQARSNIKFLIGKYLFRLFQAVDYNYYFAINSKGITRVGLGINSVNNTKIFLPTIQTQTKIANYLDTQTAKIDKKVALLEQKIQKYQELKQALINETVLRGLDKTTPLKNSGIEWIGDIPQHWEAKRGKEIIFEFQKSKIPAKEGSKDGAYKFFTSSNTQSKWLDYYQMNKQSLLFSTGGVAGINYCYKEYSYSTDCWSIKIKKYLTKYYYYLFKSILYEIDTIGFKGAGIKHLQKDFINQGLVPVFSPKEQTQIANYLDEKTSKIDAIIKTAKTQITTLTEFRKTLINDAVTGKIKVA